jgi:hypothetical protein
MNEQISGYLLSVRGRGLQVQKWVARYQVRTASVFILSYCWPLMCMYLGCSLLTSLQTATLWLIIGNWSARKPKWATICTVTSGCFRWSLAYGADRSHHCWLAPLSLIREFPRSTIDSKSRYVIWSCLWLYSTPVGSRSDGIHPVVLLQTSSYLYPTFKHNKFSKYNHAC